jgi:hypothetical protein
MIHIMVGSHMLCGVVISEQPTFRAVFSSQMSSTYQSTMWYHNQETTTQT